MTTKTTPSRDKTDQPRSISRVKTGRAGGLGSAKRTLWAAISRTKAALEAAHTAQEVVSCTHALSQAIATYVRLIEGSELEARLRAVEAIVGRRAMSNGKAH